MKIGLSLSRCVRDIVEGRVAIDDVLIIISRTDFNPHEEIQWQNIWKGYTGYSLRSLPAWAGLDHDQVLGVVIDLYSQGKLHQPRQFGAYPRRLPYFWLEAVLTAEDMDNNPAAKSAWEQFQIIAGLTNLNVEEHKE